MFQKCLLRTLKRLIPGEACFPEGDSLSVIVSYMSAKSAGLYDDNNMYDVSKTAFDLLLEKSYSRSFVKM